VTIGEGWRRGSYGYNMRRYAFGTDLALLCELQTDGRTVVTSDETWEASQDGPLGENDPMRLERYDARQEIENWHPVRPADFGFGNLVGSGAPVTPHERFKAKLLTTPNGGIVLDFGQNFAGYVELDVTAKGGEKIVLTHGEVLDADGNFQNDNFQNKSCPLCRQVVEYICKPGRNLYHRTKGYYGFRYVLLETDLPVTGAEFTGVAVYSDMEETAAFTCGNEAVNRLFRNTIWSMKSNFVDIPTDCPHREKLGFTGDCQVFSEAALYLMDCLPVLSRYLREAASSQFEDGMVPGIVPRSGGKLKPTGKDGSAGWSDAIVIVPYRILRMTDSVLSAEEWYPNMKKWVLCQLFRMKESRPENAALPPEIRDHILDTADNWGEWCEPGRTTAEYAAEGRETGHAELATAFTAQGCLYLSRIAGRLGKRDDEAFFRAEYEKIREAYRAVFTDHGRISSDRQCRYVRPVAHELLSTEESRIAVENLVRLIRSNGGAIGTGFLTTCYLNSVLTEYGFASAAYDLLLRKEQPSWLFEVEQGATTIWENWFGIREDGSRRGSHNHYAFGAVSAWLMKYVLGIGLSGGELTLRPYPDRRLGFAEGSFLSPLGRIASSWRYEGEEIVFTFEVPPNCRAAAKLPGKETVSLEPGRHSFRIRASEKAE
ncbi:MAG: family 78 glycoside hydrolase catalytic domain, partial [Lachnospiraceae bacterium]|nr:family 78 glycoside hydrolase catalytic domain [Lachnospiraceae bacterium]